MFHYLQMCNCYFQHVHFEIIIQNIVLNVAITFNSTINMEIYNSVSKYFYGYTQFFYGFTLYFYVECIMIYRCLSIDHGSHSTNVHVLFFFIDLSFFGFYVYKKWDFILTKMMRLFVFGLNFQNFFRNFYKTWVTY